MDPQKKNVVTYVVVANAPNPDKMLMPGMTANARIVIDAHTNVRRGPVAALRAPAERGSEAPTSGPWGRIPARGRFPFSGAVGWRHGRGLHGRPVGRSSSGSMRRAAATITRIIRACRCRWWPSQI